MFVCVIVESQDFDYHHQELEKKKKKLQMRKHH